MKGFALVVLSGLTVIACSDRGENGSITEVGDGDRHVVRDIMDIAAATYAGDGPVRPARVVLGSWETLAKGGGEEWRQRLVAAIQEVAEEDAKSPLSDAPWLLAFEESEQPDFLGWLPGAWDGSVDLRLYDKEDLSDCGGGFAILVKVEGNAWKTELTGEAMIDCIDPAGVIRDVVAGEAPFGGLR